MSDSEWQEHERRHRQRVSGCVKFIGELSLKQLVLPKIVLFCMSCLLEDRADAIDEKIEVNLGSGIELTARVQAVCKLMQIAGKKLEAEGFQLDAMMERLKALAAATGADSKPKLPARIRFMIQVIRLS